MNNNNYIDKVNKDKMLKGSLSSIKEMVRQFLDDCTDKESLLLFMDLSSLVSVPENLASDSEAVSTLKEFDSVGAKIFVSFSSGAISVRNNIKFSMLNFCTKIEEILEGFTEFQARKFLHKVCSPFIFTDVKHITGNNPYLLKLTLLPKFNNDHSIAANVSLYKSVARDAAETWLSDNLKLLSPESSTLEEFFFIKGSPKL